MYLTGNPENGRGCGDRTEGDVYACCGLSSRGFPMEYFLYDPVVYHPWQRGCEIVARDPESKNPIYDLWIYVGRDPKSGTTDGYPSMWSFASEVGKFGLSRKTDKNKPYHLLSRGESLIKLVHPHAIPTFDYAINRDRPYNACKRFKEWANKDKGIWEKLFGYHPHPAKAKTYALWETPVKWANEELLLPPEKCAMALRDLACLDHFDDAICRANVTPREQGDDDIWFNAEMPSFSFSGQWPKAVDFENVSWLPGLFMWLPLTHFEIPHSDKDGMVDKLNKQGWEAVVTEW